jgi:hypothetical protein
VKVTWVCLAVGACACGSRPTDQAGSVNVPGEADASQDASVDAGEDATCSDPCADGCGGCLLQGEDGGWSCVGACPPSFACNPISRRCEFVPCPPGAQCLGMGPDDEPKAGTCGADQTCCTACLQPSGACKPSSVPTCGDHGAPCVVCPDGERCVDGACR